MQEKETPMSGEEVEELPPAGRNKVAKTWPFEDMEIGDCRRFILGSPTDHSKNTVTRNAFWQALSKVKTRTKMDFVTETRDVAGVMFIYTWRVE